MGFRAQTVYYGDYYSHPVQKRRNLICWLIGHQGGIVAVGGGVEYGMCPRCKLRSPDHNRTADEQWGVWGIDLLREAERAKTAFHVEHR